MRKILSLSINDNTIIEKLDNFAKRSHTNRSDIIKKALRQFLYLQELKQLRDELRPIAEEQGYFSDEDVFKNIS
ncbi:MAG: ribbon-helix-helix protein, CopG family [Spirochaetes bacterium]|nr:ribbon-helix-helix protein, CopG family [Spirochaetota bacterium]